MEAQGIAVAEAVGLPFSLKRVRIKGAMRLLPARLQIHVPPERLLRSVESNKPLAPPWPRLVISIGRRSVPIALAIKRAASAFGLHIQNPRVPPELFDLVAAPVHDNFEGRNVITTFGAVHSVTGPRLADAAKGFAVQVDSLPHPHVTVLLGGESQAFSFPPEDAASFGAKLARLARENGASPLVTPSRRTSPEALAALSAAIKDVPHIVWDGTGDNPYFAFLALADAIVASAREVKPDDTIVRFGGPGHEAIVGGGHFAVMAGTCAVESRATNSGSQSSIVPRKRWQRRSGALCDSPSIRTANDPSFVGIRVESVLIFQVICGPPGRCNRE